MDNTLNLLFQGTKKIRTGIGGIEKNIAQKNQATDKDISVAFEDLSKLMGKVKNGNIFTRTY